MYGFHSVIYLFAIILRYPLDTFYAYETIKYLWNVSIVYLSDWQFSMIDLTEVHIGVIQFDINYFELLLYGYPKTWQK